MRVLRIPIFNKSQHGIYSLTSHSESTAQSNLFV